MLNPLQQAINFILVKRNPSPAYNDKGRRVFVSVLVRKKYVRLFAPAHNLSSRLREHVVKRKRACSARVERRAVRIELFIRLLLIANVRDSVQHNEQHYDNRDGDDDGETLTHKMNFEL